MHRRGQSPPDDEGRRLAAPQAQRVDEVSIGVMDAEEEHEDQVSSLEVAQLGRGGVARHPDDWDGERGNLLRDPRDLVIDQEPPAGRGEPSVRGSGAEQEHGQGDDRGEPHGVRHGFGRQDLRQGSRSEEVLLYHAAFRFGVESSVRMPFGG